MSGTSSPLAYAQYLQLLDQHGRTALAALAALEPEALVSPHGAQALGYAREHLATLQVWAWLLAHPELDWRGYEPVTSPTAYDDVLAGIDRERGQVVRLLVDAGPDLELDYFGRPGTGHDVARLLAHESISVAAAAAEATGTAAPPLSPDVASDCVDRALAHWSEPDAQVAWLPAPAHLVAADTGRSWWVRFGADQGEHGGAIAPGPAGPAALTLTDTSDSLLRWLEGYSSAFPQVEGDEATLRLLRVALGHRLQPEPRRPWWRR